MVSIQMPVRPLSAAFVSSCLVVILCGAVRHELYSPLKNAEYIRHSDIASSGRVFDETPLHGIILTLNLYQGITVQDSFNATTVTGGFWSGEFDIAADWNCGTHRVEIFKDGISVSFKQGTETFVGGAGLPIKIVGMGCP
jgi:hypothetical protein